MNLSQRTGEDWNGAKLILSTSETDVLNAGVPMSNALVIEPKQPPPPPLTARRLMPRGRGRAVKRKSVCFVEDTEPLAYNDDDVVDDDEAEEDYECEEADLESMDLLDADLPEMSESGAIISKTPMGVNYTVDELTTIRSDGESHKVLVATIPLEAIISHITTPRKSPLAYLQVCLPPSRSVIQLTVLRHIVFGEEHERVLPASWNPQRLPRRFIRLQNRDIQCWDWGHIPLHSRVGHLDSGLQRFYGDLRDIGHIFVC